MFSLRVLYQEHGFGPNLLWGLGPGRNVFPMRFYRRWRRGRQRTRPDPPSEARRGRSACAPHDYLALHELEGPPLPRRNRAVSNVYPPLPAKSTSLYSNDPRAEYVTRESRPAVGPVSTAAQSFGPAPVDKLPRGTPPAADARTPVVPIPSAAANTVGLPVTRTVAGPATEDDLFPKGPIGDVMRGGPRL